MRELTIEQEQRREILFFLRVIEIAQEQYQHLTSPYADTFWIHSTDTHITGDKVIDLQQLIECETLKRVDVDYQPQGDWRDNYAPSAFVLTEKGKNIFRDSSAWVWQGEA